MKNAILRDTRRTIERSMSRFVSIIAIVALGISFFAGMGAIMPDMRDTVEEYYSSANIMDIQIMSTIGLTDKDLEAVSAVTGVETVVAQDFVDGLLTVNGETVADLDGSQLSVRALALDINAANGMYDRATVTQAQYMNRVTLVEGRFPAASNECLVDASTLSTPDEFAINSVISIEGDGEDLSDKLVNTEFTIVGVIRTPLYVSYDRGSTTVGNGKLSTFVYIPNDNFTLDYYPMIWCKIAGSDAYEPYSDEYDSFINPYIEVIRQIIDANVSSRSAELIAEYAAKVKSGESEYKEAESETQKKISDAAAQLAELKNFAENGDEQIAQLKAKYNELATTANQTIDSSRLELSAEYKAWEEKRDKYNEAKALVDQYADADTQYSNALNTYKTAQLQVSTLSTTVNYLERLVATTRSAVDTLDESQSTSVSSIIDRFTESGLVGAEVDSIIASIKSMTAVGTAEEISAYLEPELQELETQLAATRVSLDESQKTLNETKQKLDSAEKLVKQLKELETALTTAEAELSAAESALKSADSEIQFNELQTLSQLQDMKYEISNAETQLSLAKEKVKTADADYEAAVNAANEKLAEAKAELDNAKQKLSELDVAVGYTWGRDNAMCGYEEYGQTIQRTKALATIFPWFFFLVAALVCLNTMTRMVEEERTQQGTLKALGYDNSEIAGKYIIYALLASLIGSIAGSCLGFCIFPTAVCKAYSILYDVPDVTIAFRWPYAVVGTVIAVGSTVAAAAIAAFSSLKTRTAKLMRPKAPKAGKRVLLEKAGFIWSRLSFTSKVTFRNVARSKKRFIMAVTGVMGCTALMLASFGLSDSVRATLTKQFTDDSSVCRYDLQIALQNAQGISDSGESEILNIVAQRPEVSSAMLNHIKVYDAASGSTDKTMEMYLVVPQDSAQLSSYVKLENRTTGQQYTLDDTGVIITEKLAHELGLSAGSSLIIKRDTGDLSVYVSAVVENYTFHYVYMSRTVYAAIFGEQANFNYITAVLNNGITAEQQQTLAAELMDDYRISAVSYTEDVQSMFSNIVTSLNYVVMILIFAAGLLALIVLYNLSSININERVREIATLKVLGFNDGEVSAYIFRENLILSVIGTFFGLFVGILLHKAVIAVAEVDIVMFGRTINWVSYVYAAVLSLGFSLLVNLILFKRLKKVDMVESLKSVE